LSGRQPTGKRREVVAGVNSPEGGSGQGEHPDHKEYVRGQKRMLHARMLESKDVAALTDREFRIFVSMILLADDDGRGRADADLLKARIYWKHPGVTKKAIEEAKRGIGLQIKVRYYADMQGNLFYQFDKWEHWQRIRKDIYQASELPPPPDPSESSLQHRNNIVTSSLQNLTVDQISRDQISKGENREAQEKKDAGRKTERHPQGITPPPPLETAPCPLKDGSTPLLIRWEKDLGMETPSNDELTPLAIGFEKYCQGTRKVSLCRPEGPCGCQTVLEEAIAHVKEAMMNAPPAERIAALAAYLPSLAKRRATQEALAAGGTR
jgi:hypothetical protein